MSELKNSLRSLESEASQRDDHNKIEIDFLRGDLAKCRKEKDAALARTRDLEQSSESFRRKLASTQQEHTNKLQATEGSLRDAHTKIASYEAKLNLARDSFREIQTALQSSKDAHSRAEARVAEQAAQLDAMRRDFERQVESIVPSYKEESEKFKRRMADALSKEKKRADAYKTKALEAHAKVKTLSHSLTGGDN